MPNHQINPNKWIDLYSDYLFNYTITRVSDREIAQDLVQDTFLAGLTTAFLIETISPIEVLAFLLIFPSNHNLISLS